MVFGWRLALGLLEETLRWFLIKKSAAWFPTWSALCVHDWTDEARTKELMY